MAAPVFGALQRQHTMLAYLAWPACAILSQRV